MTDNTNNLLAVFEERIHDLIQLCDDRKKQIEALESAVNAKNEEMRQTNETMKALQSKNSYLLTARRLDVNETEFQNARKQVNKLVREVETCIALLK
ncbi:MAG: hypothetical protein LBE91_11420 [Tannerella sp.]|jgi:predicted  nucleic acid-binding Zn-ribbon protein|nr:hypothetical protein [Tannerella sp.]